MSADRLLPRHWDGRRLLRFLTGLALLALAFAVRGDAFAAAPPVAVFGSAPAGASSPVAPVLYASSPLADATARGDAPPPAGAAPESAALRAGSGAASPARGIAASLRRTATVSREKSSIALRAPSGIASPAGSTQTQAPVAVAVLVAGPVSGPAASAEGITGVSAGAPAGPPARAHGSRGPPAA